MKTQTPVHTARQLLHLAVLLEHPTVELAEHAGIDLETLQSAHVRLFVNNPGGVQAPPYAGCYLEEKDRLEFMDRYSGACRRRGVALQLSEPPDYIPMMMEVLALLLMDDAQRQEIGLLLADCYAEWPDRFSAALHHHDQTGFYAAVADEFAAIVKTLILKTH